MGWKPECLEFHRIPDTEIIESSHSGLETVLFVTTDPAETIGRAGQALSDTKVLLAGCSQRILQYCSPFRTAGQMNSLSFQVKLS